MDHGAHLDKKFANMKCQQAKLDEASVPGLEHETIELQHLLVEPKPDNVSVDGAFCLSKENSWKHLDFEPFYYGFDYDIKRNFGGLDCNTQGQDVLGLGVLDGLLDEVDEVDDIHAANDISGACEDFLLDLEIADKICNLEYAPSRNSCVENSGSEGQSPELSGSSISVIGLSESSAVTLPESQCKNVSVEKTSLKSELYDSCEDKIDYQILAGNFEYTTSLDLEHLDELDNTKPCDSGISSDENEKNATQTSKIGTLFGQRRLRKPTKRYIDEFSVPKAKHESDSRKDLDTDVKDECLNVTFRNELHHLREESSSETLTQETLEVEDDEKLSELKSRCVTGRRKISYSAPMAKRMKILPRNEHHHLKSPNFTPLDVSRTGTNQEPICSRSRRGPSKNFSPVTAFDSDDECSESDSEDDCVKRRSKKSCDRRKHQRMWTLAEVSKLIDGIAQCGTGRWTDIKKLSFSSSAYRTPVDLRDKWRNLLRASSAPEPKLNKHKKEDEEKLKNVARTLPKAVIRRIRELAILHPYPRFTPGGRYIRRKN
ncbi:TRF-like 8 [Euphorbia peplus]|nr:TRF-like 8 [Euphorbia peplus]